MTPRRTGLLPLVLACSVLPALAGSASAAPPTCGGEVATIVGTAGADVLTGTDGPDVIAGLAGPDRIDGGGGDDLVCGGDGADRLVGGEGDDTLLAGAARYISDRGGDGYRPDLLEGGPGDDVLDIGPREPNADSGDVTGTLRYDRAPGPVSVDLGAGTASGEGEDSIVPRSGIRLVGSRFDDVLRGGPLAEEILAGAGADTVHGEAGDDRLTADPTAPGDPAAAGQDDLLVGGNGRDVLRGTQGGDVLSGGPGIDLVEASGAGPQRVRGGTEQDFLTITVTGVSGWLVSGGESDDDSLDVYLPEQRPGRQPVVGLDLRAWKLTLDGEPLGLLADVERIAAGSTVPLDVVGTAGREVVTGGSRAVLRARTLGGPDQVTGGRRADVIDTGAGRDEADGGAGRDTCRHAEVVRRCEVF